jgi:hypothetical protein
VGIEAEALEAGVGCSAGEAPVGHQNDDSLDCRCRPGGRGVVVAPGAGSGLAREP